MTHESTFEYLKPAEGQIVHMAIVREAFADMAKIIDKHVPDGPDKTHTIRLLRTAGMWANVAITRQPDGSPRE